MERKTKQAIIGTSIALLIIFIVIIASIMKSLTPSKEVMALDEYYKVNDNEVLIILQDKVYDKKGLLADGKVYLDYDTIISTFNKRFHWDENENILSYTTPTEVIKAEVGSNEYLVNKNKKEVDKPIVKMKGDQVFISIDFIKQYSNLKYEFYNEPNRVVISYKTGDYLYTTVKNSTQLRVEPSIKSDILQQLEPDAKLIYVDTSEVVKKGFSKVMTEDGIIGYVKNKNVRESDYGTIESDYAAPAYTHITKEGTINLVWHQVTNQDANNGLLNLLEKTKSVTTISPTWFKVVNNEGSISSLASETYVNRAHSQGVEVWALVDDFNPEVDMYEVLSYTSKREKLINELIAEVIKYNIDGINIDFERISAQTGEFYIQFIRELSVKCRNNSIVLSIDNYVPADYSAYYDREEQGVVADYVIIMAYDEHHGNSEVSGSVSSLGFVKQAIERTLEMVPKERIIMGIPFYTRLWKEVQDNGTVKVTSEAIGMSGGMDTLKNNGVEPEWDKEAGQYYGEYQKEDATYKIWLEEDESIETKLKLIDQADLAGIACWKLGLEKESVWNVIQKYIN
jgi:spore germination protein YaaH